MKQKAQHFLTQLKYIPATFKMIWQASKFWTAAWFALLLVQGLVPAVTIYATGWLVDALAAALGGGATSANVRPVVVPALLLGGLLLAGQIIGRLLVWVRTGQSEYLKDHLSTLIQRKAVELDLAFYENPAQQDYLFQARRDLKTRPLLLLENSGLLIQNSITLVAIIALIVPFGWWVPLILFAGGLPGIFILLRHNRIRHKWWQANTETRRWADYFDQATMHERAAAEVRLLGLGDFFMQSYASVRHTLRTEQLSLVRKQGLAQIGAVLLSAVSTAGVLLWIVIRALNGAFSIGDLVLFYQSVNRGQTILAQFMNSTGQVYTNTLFLSNLFELLHLEPNITDPENPQSPPHRLRKEIRFHAVSFRYPGSDRWILKDFDFTIPADRVTAIVGSNGAGKSTLIKLICRFYDPEAGHITFDGVDIRAFAINDLRKMLTVLFQFPTRFTSTVAENIEMGDLTIPAHDERLQTVAEQAGAHDFIARLPKGYESLLGKSFANGTDLSGGEWQRLALARSFWREAPIMILDEPTSAMDSWSEADWYARLNDLLAGKTALLITHRLSTAKKATLIHVMESGKIVESGTHEQLLAKNGRYAQAWQGQGFSTIKK